MKQPLLLLATATLVTAFLMAPSFVSAADYREYLFRGTVVDTDDQPIADVTLTLKHQTNNRRWKAETNKKGEYKFVGLPHGVYDVTIAKDGYQTHTQEWRYQTSHQEMKRVKLPPLVLLSSEQVERMESSQRVKGHFEEANAMLEEGNVDGALASALAVLEDRPDDANGLYIAGMCYLEKGQIDEAIAVLSRSAAQQPDFAPTFIRLGVCYQRKGEVDAALAAYDRAIELDPESVPALYNASAMLYNADRAVEALPYIERTLAFVTDDFTLYEMAGYAQLQSEGYDKALEHFVKARDLMTADQDTAVIDELVTALRAQVDNQTDES